MVVPTFNRLALLRETVNSLRAQTVADARFILVDDGSFNETALFLDSLDRVDSRFEVIVKPASDVRGAQSSRNIGLRACRGEIVTFLDSDDLLEPDCLQRRSEFLEAHPSADIVVGRQAILSPTAERMRWVNVQSPVPELDRFLDLTHPIDVPWVNGGVTIRSSTLEASGVSWLPEFDWDDVAFHFHCIVAGLQVAWMNFDAPPDSYYRMHEGPRFGDQLSTAKGIRSAAEMVCWMRHELEERNLLTSIREASLVRSFYFGSVLRAVDMEDYDTASSLVGLALAAGLIGSARAAGFRAYVNGRHVLRSTSRATFYFNRLSELGLVPAYSSSARSTYGTVPAVNPSISALHP